MNYEPTAVFVYGTLKRGEVRERCWPRRPITVEPATTRGALYDLGPYPALVPGDDIVAGELWQLAPEDMDVTLTALDRVEAYANRPDDLYHRVIVECQTAAGRLSAWTYCLAQTNLLQSTQRIMPGENCVCVWTSHHSTS